MEKKAVTCLCMYEYMYGQKCLHTLVIRAKNQAVDDRGIMLYKISEYMNLRLNIVISKKKKGNITAFFLGTTIWILKWASVTLIFFY